MKDIFLVKKIVEDALKEDIHFGDITSEIIDDELEGTAYFLAKEDFILCGTNVAILSFALYDHNISVTFDYKDGDKINRGVKFGSVNGRLKSILTCERVALNFLQHLSGIATATFRIAEKVKNSGVSILDTRKTTPLLRVLEKYAVSVGGGLNHRLSLSDGILIKDNHIKACGSITKAINVAKKIKRPLTNIGVEVKNIKEVKEALKAGATHLLFDNMSPSLAKKAAQIVEGKASIEISGGINEKNITEYVFHGVNYISLGSITHSAKAVDISLEIE